MAFTIEAGMKYLGEIDGKPCYWAEPERFEKPGFWYWDGSRNVHVPHDILDRCLALHEIVNPASDQERIDGSPGAGAMGAVIEYRDLIKAIQ